MIQTRPHLIATSTKRSKGRPQKKVDLKKLRRLRASGLSYRKLAKAMKLSVKTVVKNLNSTLDQQQSVKIALL